LYCAVVCQVSAALLVAIVVGMLLACIIFMLQYANVSIIRDITDGIEYQVTTVHDLSHLRGGVMGRYFWAEPYPLTHTVARLPSLYPTHSNAFL
jgi:MFS superfamily sulfate permease-like transporter